jgi:hypothetical protein
MMTVFYKPMRRRRWMRIEAGQEPPTWKTFPMHDKGTTGSAKPGRGGRRKRARRAAGTRAAHLFCVGFMAETYGKPTPRALGATLDRAARLTPNLMSPSAMGPGRRERRRRAKLRRRRERARREGRPTPIAAPMPWEAASLEHATGERLDRLAEMFGLSRTPGI